MVAKPLQLVNSSFDDFECSLLGWLFTFVLNILDDILQGESEVK